MRGGQPGILCVLHYWQCRCPVAGFCVLLPGLEDVLHVPVASLHRSLGKHNLALVMMMMMTIMMMISDSDTYKGEYYDNSHLALPWTVLHCGQ